MRKRKDSNHKEVVAALKQMGASVFDSSDVGKGFPDLVVGFLGVTHLVEIKDGSRSPSRRKIRASQQSFADGWGGSPVLLVESPEGALKLIKKVSALLSPSPMQVSHLR